MTFGLSEKHVVSSLVNIDSQKILCFNRFLFFRLSCSSLPYAPRLLVASPCVGSGSLQATTGPKKKENRAPGVYRVEKMAKQFPMALIRHRVPLHPRMLTWNLKMSSKVMIEGISAPIIMHGEFYQPFTKMAEFEKWIKIPICLLH